MEAILKSLIPIFSLPKNYGELLGKLAGFAFWECYIATWILRIDPHIEQRLSSLELALIPAKLQAAFPTIMNLNPLGFFIAAIVALLFYASQFHNLVAKMLNIRQRFDMGSILLPLAHLVGHSLTNEQLYNLRSQRDRVMGEVFYKYSSSKIEKPLVDPHNIHQALQSWSWFWIAEEGTVIWFAAMVFAYYSGSLVMTFTFSLLFVAYVLWALVSYPILEPRARAQIEQIVANPEASLHVKSVFVAL
jgi:hypothetical protein